MADASDKQLVTVGYLNKRLEPVEKTIPEYALHPENLEKLSILNNMDVNTVAFTNKYDSIDSENKPILSVIDGRLETLEHATLGDDSDIRRYINEELGFKLIDGQLTLTKQFHLGLNTEAVYDLGNTTLRSKYTFTLKNKTLVVETKNVNFVGDFPYSTLLEEQQAVIGVVNGLNNTNQRIDNLQETITSEVSKSIEALYGKRISSLEQISQETSKTVNLNTKGIKKLEQSLNDFKSATGNDIQSLKNDSAKHETDITTLNTNVNNLDGNITSLEERLTGKDGTITKLSNEVQTLNNEVITLKEDVESNTSTIDALDERTTELEKYKTESSSSFSELKTQVEQNGKSIDDIKVELSPDNKNPIVRNKQFKDTIDTLGGKIDDLVRTNKVEKDSTKLVESGGVWNAIEGFKWTENISEYEDILIYLLDKRRKYEFSTLHKVYQWMNRLMAVVLQVYFSQKNGPYVPDFGDDAQLTKEDWKGLREIVDVGEQLLILLERLQLTTKDGTIIDDNPLYEGNEFKQDEIVAFKKMLVYKDEIIMLVGRTINKSKQR